MGQTASAETSGSPDQEHRGSNQQQQQNNDENFDQQEQQQEEEEDDTPKGPTIQILYGSSKTKTAMSLAYKLGQRYAIKHSPLPVNVCSIDQFEPENLNKLDYVVFIMATHDNGTPAPNAKLFMDWLDDASKDFRYGKSWAKDLQFSVVGVGSSDYKKNFNAVAKDVKLGMKAMGANLFARPCILDYSNNVDASPDALFEQWCLHVLLPAVKAHMKKMAQKQKDNQVREKQKETAASLREGEAGEEQPYDYEEEEEEDEDFEEEEDMVDVEDMGAEMGGENSNEPKKPRKMLTERTHRALTKQGYRIVGSHSAVKLCRWTKAATRGRGFCYKNALYGIQSHQCMEMTPSLACASRCTFCWRGSHHPTSREFNYEMDEPEMIIDGAIANHKKMIEIFKGTPGLRQDRYQQALKPKHCALSLVGEPIMYPEINKFIDYLHLDNDISSFLVTNAQFPDQMVHLHPVTQLYLSIDAHSRESLKAIDRPLLEDFWERFIKCQEILATKKTRTVYRLTLVKGFNMDEAVQGYAKLIAIGKPTFIEVKGVTFSGPDGGLTMKNVPYHQEVKEFCELLAAELKNIYATQREEHPTATKGDVNYCPEYELSGEHAHSCCVLLSDTRMKRNGEWYTWIDYPKFQELYKKWKETGEEFTDEDYSCPTPAWALYGSAEAGFSPDDTRFTRNITINKQKRREAEAAAAAAAAAAGQTGGCCQTNSNGDEQQQQQQGCCSTQTDTTSSQCCKQVDGEEKKSEQQCCKQQEEQTQQPKENKSEECCGGDECCKK